MANQVVETVNGQYELTLTQDSDVVLHYTSDVNVNLTINEGVTVNLVTIYDGVSDVNGSEQIHINQDAVLNWAIVNFEDKASNITAVIDMDGTNSNVLVRSGFLVNNNKLLSMRINHHQPYTTSLMEHYGLVIDQHQFMIEGIGKVDKYAKKSDCRQALRAATFAEKENVKLIPELLIDEYDVQAAHATSIGQVNDRQLYYLQSKGLNMNQILHLMAKGYLQPVCNLIVDEQLKQQVSDQIESVVVDACLM